MKLLVLDTPGDVERKAAEQLAELIGRRPEAVLGLATGATMEGVYESLVARCRAGTLSLRQATTFNLDEYLGLAPGDPASYRATMERQFFGRTDLARERTHLPRGDAADPDAEAARYEAAIHAAGGIDLQLLGVGRNGHVGFNEPGADPLSRTRVVRLSQTTRADNRTFFATGRPVPERAITLGIATILEARSLLLLATGATKSATLARALSEPKSPDCPASLLRDHRDLTILVDRAAASAIGGETPRR